MPPITRRELARNSALAAGLVGTSGWLGWDCGGEEPSTAARLAKCVSMGSMNNGGDPQDLTAHGNLDLVLETGAPWVRIWIRWDKAQPLPPARVPLSVLGEPANDLPECGTGCGFRYIQSIDAQVAQARAAGLRVILTTWHFPRWANGTEGVPDDWAREDRGWARTPVAQLKAMEYRVPVGQLGPDGHYGRWIDWLVRRYGEHGEDLVLELMNEPNHQLWPQQGPSTTGDPYGPGPRVIDSYVAEMMNTARAVSEAHGHPIRIAGPAMTDRDGSDNRLMTRFTTLAPEILSRLDSQRFPSTPSFVWTHHNYTDVERGSPSPSGVEELRARLRGRWRGRGGRGNPRIWLTEGGARLGSGLATDLERQAALVRRNWRRMRAARGVELWTNYLLYSDPTADSGLRESRESGGAPRPVWDVFGSLRA
jgi:Cellulase (glycosyl hydrolase family 5)